MKIRRLSRALLLLLLAVGVLGTESWARDESRVRGKVETVEEAESGIELPVTISVLGGAETHTITGVALREKTIFEVDVYVAGHYVDRTAARTELAKWLDKSAEDLAKDDALRKKLLAPGFARTLRLRLARDIDSEDFNEAFEESLGPRVKKLVADGIAGKQSDVAALKALFTLDELAETSNIDLTWKGTTLTVAMNDEALGAVDSDALCRALWDVYFGDDPIQDHFPAGLMSRLSIVLATQKAATAVPATEAAEEGSSREGE